MPTLVQTPLTDRKLKSLKPETSRYEVKDSAVRGLGIRVAPSGSKKWFAMKRVNGKNVRVAIGSYPGMGLADARANAAVVIADMAAGTYAKDKPSEFVESALEEWLKRDQTGNRSYHEVERAIRRDVLPQWQGRKITSIRRTEIISLLDKVADRGAITYANRLRAYIKRFLTWCVERGILEHSPADKVPVVGKETSRDRVLTEDELARVWCTANNAGYPFGPLFRLLILTGQRRNEVAKAEWPEFDLEAKTWTIPGSRAKNGQQHVVHLSDEALVVLNGIPNRDDSELLFTTNGATSVSGFSKAKAALDKVSGVSGWRIHDLRRTFATIATGNLGIPPHVVDKILNHVSGAVKGVAAVYQRAQYSHERQEAMEAWGRYIRSLDRTIAPGPSPHFKTP